MKTEKIKTKEGVEIEVFLEKDIKREDVTEDLPVPYEQYEARETAQNSKIWGVFDKIAQDWWVNPSTDLPHEDSSHWGAISLALELNGFDQPWDDD